MPNRISSLTGGRYSARISRDRDDVAAAQALRTSAFATGVTDRDAFDNVCDHLLIHDVAGHELVCCARVLTLNNGRDLDRSYSAQFYHLAPLGAFTGRMVEMGRFCVHPDWPDPDILRMGWAALTRYVDENNIELLFGCSSFSGINADAYQDTFSLLGARFLAPPAWRPGAKAQEVVPFDGRDLGRADSLRAMRQMPSLLRTYLAMGGWVSDHAVVDRVMQTLHVFTGLEVAAIPSNRKRLLREVAGKV